MSHDARATVTSSREPGDGSAAEAQASGSAGSGAPRSGAGTRAADRRTAILPALLQHLEATAQDVAITPVVAMVAWIQAEIDAGVLPGPCPDLTTVWRWIRPARRAAGAGRHAGVQGPEPASLEAVTPATAPSRVGAVPRLPPEAPRVAVLRDVAVLSQLAEDLADEAQQARALTPTLRKWAADEKRLTRKLRTAETSPRKPAWTDEGVRVRYERLWRLAADLEAALAAARAGQGAARPQAAPVAARGPEAAAAAPTRTVPAVLAPPSTMPFATADALIAAGGGAEHAAAEPWGAAAARAPRPALGATVGYEPGHKTREDAEIRATLLAPVLNGTLTPRRAAAAWQAVFRNETNDDAALWLPPARSLPPAAQATYYAIHEDTLRGWLRRVHEAQRDAVRDGASVNPADVLMHRQPAHVRAGRKLTAEVGKAAIAHYKGDGSRSAVHTADHLREDHGIDISDRQVQRYLARKIGDEERVRARGGPAADDVLRVQMIRRARYPNHIWLMDHSFFVRELVDPAHPEWTRGLRDFDFDCEFAMLRHSIGSELTRRRVAKMSMTLVQDACTRRCLALRVWEGTPSTLHTLLALRDAMERFGRPDFLYTDNGADLTSKLMRAALAMANIHHVRSVPYEPRARGIIERNFGTIKRKILPTMPGFTGGPTPRQAADEELLDHATFERTLFERVDLYLNRGGGGTRPKVHGETGRVPSDHYDAEIGARALATPSADELLALLTVRIDVKREEDGVHLLGGRYAGDGLLGTVEGTPVMAYVDPYRPELAHIGLRAADGRIISNGIVERYGPGGKQAPEYDQYLSLEAGWRAERDTAVAALSEGHADALLATAQRQAGDALAGVLAAGVADELQQLDRGAAITAADAGDGPVAFSGPRPRALPAARAPALAPALPLALASAGARPAAESRPTGEQHGDGIVVRGKPRRGAGPGAPRAVVLPWERRGTGD